MKVLFLDIDGVLNSIDNMSVQGNLWHINNENKSRDDFGHLFDERCCRWLKYIVEKTQCKIVISSTWRMSGLKTMRLMWDIRDLAGDIIDITPTTVSQYTINLYANTSNTADRGYEIQEWLDINKPNRYCIVDDNNDMLSHQIFVRTDGQIGLNYQTANKIVSFLNAL